MVMWRDTRRRGAWQHVAHALLSWITTCPLASSHVIKARAHITRQGAQGGLTLRAILAGQEPPHFEI